MFFSAIERIWHTYDSQGQILALAFRGATRDRGKRTTAVKRILHMQDSQGPILALAFRLKSLFSSRCFLFARKRYAHSHLLRWTSASESASAAESLCRANMAHTRQSRPDSSIGSHGKVLQPLSVVSCSLVSGTFHLHLRRWTAPSLSHRMYSSTSFKKSTPPRSRQHIVYHH